MTWGLVTAFRTLTILPVPGRDAGEMASSLPWFPVVGGVLGSLFAALALVTNELSGGHWPGGAAAAALAGGIVLTRAIHLDGLADWADGFGGGGDRKKTLAIMKDSATGVFGVTAIVAVLLIKCPPGGGNRRLFCEWRAAFPPVGGFARCFGFAAPILRPGGRAGPRGGMARREGLRALVPAPLGGNHRRPPGRRKRTGGGVDIDGGCDGGPGAGETVGLERFVSLINGRGIRYTLEFPVGYSGRQYK